MWSGRVTAQAAAALNVSLQLCSSSSSLSSSFWEVDDDDAIARTTRSPQQQQQQHQQGNNNTTDNYRRPYAIQTSTCHSQFSVEQLSFAGSASARVANLFATRIAASITASLQQLLCPVTMPHTVDPWLTQQVQKINHWIDHYLPTTTTTSTQQQQPTSTTTLSLRDDGDNKKGTFITTTTTSNTGTKGTSFVEKQQQQQQHSEHDSKKETATTTWFGNVFLRQLTNDSKNKNSNNTINLVDLTRDVPFWKQATDWINSRVLQPHLSQGFLPHHHHNNNNNHHYSLWWLKSWGLFDKLLWGDNGVNEYDDDIDNNNNNNNVNDDMDHSINAHRLGASSSSSSPRVTGGGNDHTNNTRMMTSTPSSPSACPDCGFFFDGWNGVLKSIWPHGLSRSTPGWHFNWKIPNNNISSSNSSNSSSSNASSTVMLELHNISITSGLNEWQVLELLQIQDAQTMSSRAMTQNVSIITEWTLAVHYDEPDKKIKNDDDDDDDDSHDLVESFSIQINASSVDALLKLGLGLYPDVLQNNIRLETMVDLVNGWMEENHTAVRQAADCLLTAVESLQASQLSVQVVVENVFFTPHGDDDDDNDGNDDDGDNTQDKELERDLDTLLNHALELVLHEYQPLVTAVLRGVTEGPAQVALNRYLVNKTTGSGECPSDEDDNENLQPKSYHFTKSLAKLNRFLSRNHTLHKLNEYISCVSTFLGNMVERKLSTIMTSVSGADDDGNYNDSLFRLQHFQLVDAGSIRQMQIMSPQQNATARSNHSDLLTTAFQYGSLDGHSARPRLVVEGVISYPLLNVNGSIHLELGLDDLSVTGGSGFSYETSQFEETKLWQLLQHGACAIVPVDLTDYGVTSNLGEFGVFLQTNLSNPEWGEALNITFDSRDYPAIQDIASSSLSWAVTSFRDFAMATTQLALDSSFYICEGESPPPDETSDTDDLDYPSILLIIGAVILFAQPALLLIKRDPQRDEDETVSTAWRQSSLTEPVLQNRESLTEVPSQQMPAKDISLMQSPSVSYVISVAVPILVLSTIALLLSSNLSVGKCSQLKLLSNSQTCIRCQLLHLTHIL